MNKSLKKLIACGIWHTWGSADMECYLRDKEAMLHRLEEQYGLDPILVKDILEIIVNKDF